jgi:hypothetical protein
MAKKVLKYNEEEFVTLLENIVNRVKEEKRLTESRERRGPSNRRPSRRRPSRRK